MPLARAHLLSIPAREDARERRVVEYEGLDDGVALLVERARRRALVERGLSHVRRRYARAPHSDLYGHEGRE